MMSTPTHPPAPGAPPQSQGDESRELSLWDLLRSLWRHRLTLAVSPLVVGLVAFLVATFLPKTYTARTTLITPQQQGTTAAALASLGALSGLAGAAVGLRSPGDQYVALLQSRVVADSIINRFHLMHAYDVQLRELARRELQGRSRILLGRKDNLIVIEVDDADPQRAADIANGYVEELSTLLDRLAVTEAQQRRAFFEDQLKQTRDRLARAQKSIQSAGFGEGNIRAEPKVIAEGYSRLRAEVSSAEIQLGILRRTMTDNAPEVKALVAALQGLRAELAKFEISRANTDAGSDYIDRFREFKYQETLYELFARQYELARIDESREGGTIQVVDSAVSPEKHSRPKRSLITIGAALATLAVLVSYFLASLFLQLRPAAMGSVPPSNLRE